MSTTVITLIFTHILNCSVDFKIFTWTLFTSFKWLCFIQSNINFILLSLFWYSMSQDENTIHLSIKDWDLELAFEKDFKNSMYLSCLTCSVLSLLLFSEKIGQRKLVYLVVKFSYYIKKLQLIDERSLNICVVVKTLLGSG